MSSFIFMFLLLAGGGAVYFLVIKPRLDKKNTVSPPAVAPAATLQEEKGTFLGAGNPMGNGPRPLWKFKMIGSSYGKNIEVWVENSLLFTVPDGSVRTDGPGWALWKPKSSEPPTTLVIHGSGGSLATKCVIKFSAK